MEKIDNEFTEIICKKMADVFKNILCACNHLNRTSKKKWIVQLLQRINNDDGDDDEFDK